MGEIPREDKNPKTEKVHNLKINKLHPIKKS